MLSWGLGDEYGNQLEIREVLQTIFGEIDMHKVGKYCKFTVDQQLVDLPIAHLVAIEGHLLGASSVLSANDFNAIVNSAEL